MAALQLINRMTSDFLILPGYFIDTYVPAARGEDLKVFLYLLRLMTCTDRNRSDISLASVSDALDIPERDLLRALTYWEKTGLLQLSFNSDHVLEGISFLNLEGKTLPEKTEKTAPAVSSASSAKSAPVTPEAQEPKRPTAKDAAPAQTARIPRDLTAKETSSLDSDLDFNACVFMAEQSFGTPLNATDINRLGYWYINFDRSSQIIEALLEYCAEQCQPGKTNTRYLDAVAAGWFSDGITTPAQAREHSQAHHSLINGVMKAFGLKSKRDATPKEAEMIRKWTKEYGFSQEMILLACTRTTAKTSTGQFAYADGILSSWKRSGIRTVEEVEAADLAHRKQSTASKTQQHVDITRSARRFHNFEERDTDYESMILDQLYPADSNDE